MKPLIGLIVFLTCVCCLTAVITPFSLVGSGKYAGKMATYASGDTILFVNKAPQESNVRFNYSFNGGETWQYHDLETAFADTTAPTISYTNGELLISYTQGFMHRLLKSTNWGESFSSLETNNKTFDTSPYVENYNGQRKLFSLNLPYPEKISSPDGDEYPLTKYDNPNEYQAPQLYMDVFASPSGEMVRFMGNDVIEGVVRVNSDLWIKNTTGGNNGGWPLFLSPVIIGGTVKVYPSGDSNYPQETVFQGGLLENAAFLYMQDASFARQMGTPVGPTEYNPNDIIMITVNGNSYEGWLGHVQIPHRAHTDVWQYYPMGTNVTPLYRNNFTLCDTVWTPLPGGTCDNRTMFVNSKLWIKGEFSGHQTWVASDSIFVIGEITLSGTTPGTNPYLNSLDSVKLISEKSVLLKYGYWNPIDTLRHHPLCRADDAPMNIYASIYALGDGHGNPLNDGVFTFEYQHPHGSIPNTLINFSPDNDTLFTWIDLHRNKWPQIASQPWPSLIDFPWYNPLWPEKSPYLERGTVKVWGSVVQSRKGYMHRNYYDPEHPSYGVWNIPNGLCGGSSAPTPQIIFLYQNPDVNVTLQTRNYPGATGTGIGYKINYMNDPRTSLGIEDMISGQTYSIWNLGIDLSNWVEMLPYWSMFTPYHLKQYIKVPRSKSFARQGNMALYSVNDALLCADAESDNVIDISSATIGDGLIKSLAFTPGNDALVYQFSTNASTNAITIKQINTTSGAIVNEYSTPVTTMMNDICVMPGGSKLFAKYESSGVISINEWVGAQAQHIEDWNVGILEPGSLLAATSQLYLIPSSADEAEVFIYVKLNTSGYAIYHAHASFPVANDDPLTPPITQISFLVSPNPMRNELKLTVDMPKGKPHRFEIYNIRGQKVKSIVGNPSSDNAKLEYHWNGTDEAGRTSAKGIYFIRMYVDDRPYLTKRVCRY
ncbi:hypothetical protein MASR2M64_04530 [Candidatus Cloacimonadota bacterium]